MGGARLYVGNLSPGSTAEDVRAAFAPFGEVADVQVVTDRYTGRARGFAFVTMASPEEASQAAASLHGSLLDGRPLRIQEMDPRRPAPSSPTKR